MASSPNFNALLLQGFQTGRELRRQEGEEKAMAGLVTGSPNALTDLARYNPQAAYQMKQQQDAQAAQQEQQRQKMLTQGKQAVGQAALQIAQLPEAQRAQAWDSAIDYLAGQGWDGLAQFKGRYSEQSLMGVIAEAGLANELRNATQPQYMAPQPGAPLVNTRDPQALNAYNDFVMRGETPGQAPQQGNVPSGSPLQPSPNSKVVGDKQYWNINGKWYDNPEGR